MKKVTILLFAILLAACGDDLNFSGDETIGCNVQIEIQENQYTPGHYSLELFCRTETLFNSGGYQLITNESFKTSSLTINFIGVREPDPEASVMAAFLPAGATIDLTDLDNGKYEIALNNGSLKNKGTLTITDEEIELKVPNQNGIEILTSTLKRTGTPNSTN